MAAVGIMLWLWFLHVSVAGVLSAPLVFFGRKRVRWQAWELLAFVLPYSVWAVWMILGSGKSLANLVEYLIIAIAIPVAVLIRVLLGRGKREWIYRAGLLAALCGVAAGAYLLTPPLPE